MTDDETALALALPEDRGIALRDLAAQLGWSTRRTKRVAEGLSGERGVTLIATEAAPETVAAAGQPIRLPWERGSSAKTATRLGKPQIVVWSIAARCRVFLSKDPRP